MTKICKLSDIIAVSSYVTPHSTPGQTETVSYTKPKQTKTHKHTHTKPTNKTRQPASGICSFLGSEEKHTNSNTKKEIRGTGFSKGVYVWLEVELITEKETLSSQTITALQKQTFGILKLQVKAKNVKALLDESFLQVSSMRLLRKHGSWTLILLKILLVQSNTLGRLKSHPENGNKTTSTHAVSTWYLGE